MSKIHRDGDSRVCGATTKVIGQSTVYLDGKLVAVEGDPNTHGNGGLIANDDTTVFINNKKIIIHLASANKDDLCDSDGPPHCEPATSEGSETGYTGS